MSVFQSISIICAAGVLGACSTASPPFVPAVSGTAAANADGTYQIVEDGTTTSLAVPASSAATSALGLAFWNNIAYSGYVFSNADVTAIAMRDHPGNSTHAGLTGTAASSVPTSGSATYTGAFSAAYQVGNLTNSVAANGLARGAMSTDVDFGAGTLSGSGTGSNGTTLSVTGTISGTNFNGTATFSGTDYTGPAQADLSGGFYGTNTLAGIYKNPKVAGVIWGATP